MSVQYCRYPGSIVTTSSSTAGTVGGPAPASADQIGARDGSGNLQNLTVDASKNLNVNVQAGTLTALNPSVSTTGAAVPGDATYLGMDVGGNLIGVPGTANGVKVDGSAVTQPVSAASLPLPTGAATEATLSTLNGKVTTCDTSSVTVASSALPAGAATAANQNTGNTSLASIDGKLTDTINGLKVDGSGVTQPVSAASLPLPAGAATASNQSTANTSLASIDGKLAALGQKAMAGSEPVVIASDQSAIPTQSPINSNGSFTGTTVSTVSTITKPANAIGFILQNDASSTDYIRWCDANSAASSTNGSVLQPGQDTGYIPMSKNISICAHSGSQGYNIQWVLSS